MAREITKEELLTYKDHLTVGKLKEFINRYNMDDDSIVVVQRVKDHYYENGGWGSYLKEGEATYGYRSWNEDIKGEYLDKKRYPDLKEEDLKPFTEEQILESCEQYHPAFSCVRYNDDVNILFIDLHY